MRAEFPVLLGRHSKMQALADLGIVEPGKIRTSWDEYCRSGSVAIKIPLFLTMHVELWLQGRGGMSHHDAAPREQVVAFRD
jgi:hypothetical protein